jgi:hypothetical protein
MLIFPNFRKRSSAAPVETPNSSTEPLSTEPLSAKLLTLKKSEESLVVDIREPIQNGPALAQGGLSLSLREAPMKSMRLEWSEGIKQGDQILSWLERKRLLKPQQRYDLSKEIRHRLPKIDLLSLLRVQYPNITEETIGQAVQELFKIYPAELSGQSIQPQAVERHIDLEQRYIVFGQTQTELYIALSNPLHQGQLDAIKPLEPYHLYFASPSSIKAAYDRYEQNKANQEQLEGNQQVQQTDPWENVSERNKTMFELLERLTQIHYRDLLKAGRRPGLLEHNVVDMALYAPRALYQVLSLHFDVNYQEGLPGIKISTALTLEQCQAWNCAVSGVGTHRVVYGADILAREAILAQIECGVHFVLVSHKYVLELLKGYPALEGTNVD